MKEKKNIILIALGFFMFSCIPQHRIEYLENQTSDISIPQDNISSSSPLKIKTNDELLINVSSFDDISFNYFETQSRTGVTQASNELSLSSVSYTVNDSGFIYFPILGNIKVENLTLNEASLKLQEALSPYFNQPNVIIKFAYKKFSILGQVNNPGYHTYTKNRINIFEALAMANDITIHGNRSEIMLIREIDGTRHSYIIDLSKTDILSNDLYSLQPDDIIIVNPRKSVKWNVISTPITLVLTTISTTLLVINYVSQ